MGARLFNIGPLDFGVASSDATATHFALDTSKDLSGRRLLAGALASDVAVAAGSRIEVPAESMSIPASIRIGARVGEPGANDSVLLESVLKRHSLYVKLFGSRPDASISAAGEISANGYEPAEVGLTNSNLLANRLALLPD